MGGPVTPDRPIFCFFSFISFLKEYNAAHEPSNLHL